MMLAMPMMTATLNDVCLMAHRGKHRIITSQTSNIILFLGRQSSCYINNFGVLWVAHADFGSRAKYDDEKCIIL